MEGDFGHLGGYIWAFLISFWDIGCFLDVFEKFLGQQKFFLTCFSFRYFIGMRQYFQKRK